MATQDQVLQSLKDAADAAHSAFLAAAALDPVAAKPLWVDSINATNTFLTALNQTLQGNDTAITSAKSNLDVTTRQINSQLDTLKNLVTISNLVSQLLGLIASVAKFFA